LITLCLLAATPCAIAERLVIVAFFALYRPQRQKTVADLQ